MWDTFVGADGRDPCSPDLPEQDCNPNWGKLTFPISLEWVGDEARETLREYNEVFINGISAFLKGATNEGEPIDYSLRAIAPMQQRVRLEPGDLGKGCNKTEVDERGTSWCIYWFGGPPSDASVVKYTGRYENVNALGGCVDESRAGSGPVFVKQSTFGPRLATCEEEDVRVEPEKCNAVDNPCTSETCFECVQDDNVRYGCLKYCTTNQNLASFEASNYQKPEKASEGPFNLASLYADNFQFAITPPDLAVGINLTKATSLKLGIWLRTVGHNSGASKNLPSCNAIDELYNPPPGEAPGQE